MALVPPSDDEFAERCSLGWRVSDLKHAAQEFVAAKCGRVLAVIDELFAYHGSDLAGPAIAEAGRQLPGGRGAVVVTVWEPFSVGFLPVDGVEFNAAQIDEVPKAAEQTAAQGASLAEAAGFRANSTAAEAASAWPGVIDAADQHDASLIVLGSHGRSGPVGAFVGSVAGAVAAYSRRSVLIVHQH